MRRHCSRKEKEGCGYYILGYPWFGLGSLKFRSFVVYVWERERGSFCLWPLKLSFDFLDRDGGKKPEPISSKQVWLSGYWRLFSLFVLALFAHAWFLFFLCFSSFLDLMLMFLWSNLVSEDLDALIVSETLKSAENGRCEIWLHN